MSTVKHFKMVITDFTNTSDWSDGPKKPTTLVNKDGSGSDFSNYLTDISTAIGNLNGYSAGEKITMTIQLFNVEE